MKSEFTQAALNNAGADIRGLHGKIKSKDAQIATLSAQRDKLSKKSAEYARKNKELQALYDAQEELIKSLLDQLSRIEPGYRAALHAFQDSIRGRVTLSENLAAAFESYRAGQAGSAEQKRAVLDAALDADERAREAAGDAKLRIESGFQRRLVAYEVLDKVETGSERVSTAINYFKSAVEHGDDTSIDSLAALARLYVQVGNWKDAKVAIDTMIRVDRNSNTSRPLEIANVMLLVASFTEKPEQIDELLNQYTKRLVESEPDQNSIRAIYTTGNDPEQTSSATFTDLNLFESFRQNRGQNFDIKLDNFETISALLGANSGMIGESSLSCMLDQFRNFRATSEISSIDELCATELRQELKRTPRAPQLLFFEAIFELFPPLTSDPCMDRPIVVEASDFPRSKCAPSAKLRAALGKARRRASEIREIDPDNLNLAWEADALLSMTAPIEAALGRFDLARADMQKVLESREAIIASGAIGTKPKRDLLHAYISAIEIEIASNSLASADELDLKGSMIFGGSNALPDAQLSDEIQRLFFLSQRVDLTYKYGNVAQWLPNHTTNYLELVTNLRMKLPNDKAVRWHEWDALVSAYWVSRDAKLAKEFLFRCKAFEEAKEVYMGWQERCETNRPSMERAISEVK